MKPAIYINPEGIVCFIAACPEEPKRNDTDKTCPWRGNGHRELWHTDQMRQYHQALAAAKQSAVVIAHDSELMKTFGASIRHYLRDTIHPFPEDRYKVEVIDFNSADGSEQVAILTIPPSTEKRKNLLIEIIQEDEKNGMYEDHRVGCAATVVMFLGEYIHGVSYGKKDELNEIALRNAKDAWERFMNKVNSQVK